MPTVAYSDPFYDATGNGILPYYLATAFEQIYVQQSGLVPFAGKATFTAMSTLRFHAPAGAAEPPALCSAATAQATTLACQHCMPVGLSTTQPLTAACCQSHPPR